MSVSDLRKCDAFKFDLSMTDESLKDDPLSVQLEDEVEMKDILRLRRIEFIFTFQCFDNN